MSIKSIFALYSGDAQGSSGLRLAIQMAHKYSAHLTGAVWHGPSLLESRHGRYMNRDILGMLTDQDRQRVKEIRADFEARLASDGTGISASFLDLPSTAGFSLAACARGYDIVVMGSRAAEVGREHFTARPDVIALQSGRPLILVPQEYSTPQINEHALFAWDGKRAAARALGDAMHILETKTRVTVLTIGDDNKIGQSPGDDIMTLLKRHQIKATRLVRSAGSGGVAQTILDASAEVGAGLLVMGAYEHSKFSEYLLGGVTRDIFEMATLPVFMSH